MKEKILNHIREKTGLKRLEAVSGNHWEGNLPDIYDFEIIGLPVQLNDLLRVIHSHIDEDEWFETSIGKFNGIVKMELRTERFSGVYIDLSKTVEQNLDNPELLKLVGELLNIK